MFRVLYIDQYRTLHFRLYFLLIAQVIVFDLCLSNHIHEEHNGKRITSNTVPENKRSPSFRAERRTDVISLHTFTFQIFLNIAGKLYTEQ
jgi:hypothetical protein